MDTRRVREIVTDWYSAIGAGDTDRIMAGLSPSIVLELPLDQWNAVVPYLGVHVGRQEVAEAFRIRAETTEVLDYGLRGLFVDGDTACAVVYTKARHTRTKVLFEIEDMHRLVVNDAGLISSWKVYFDANGEVAAFNADREARLVQAVRDRDVALVGELLRFGGDTGIRDDRGLSPLMIAAGQGDLTVVRALLAGGADVLATDPVGQTALHRAAEHGDADVVRELLRSGAVLDAVVATTGQTPLHIAVRHGNPDAGQALLRQGARPGQTDHLGRTPQDLALELLGPDNALTRDMVVAR
ncbi:MULTISPECIES: ankyrin repeat domain-containing protein [Actinoalloteichus]|uniref:Ankyrin repeat-containing protein n=1 Tax=Actinoalloteichus fjordicus TaxID=1612552 RepID=A0AAC9L9B5_9PSEU|nr:MULTISPECIES: ankyrin repeat domain-containing protein [Actinoalloteichus]APU13573.1 ankyrin repeat-containing protein [Actinoalloteichus fjordicus]APU19520.1 ankyrin repeat-containing protein [Actinoalloteichus sp. GBA129-24]